MDKSQLKIARFSGTLAKDQIFCFFSNGHRHSQGSAVTALNFGADHDIHQGFSGSTFAVYIMEKDGNLKDDAYIYLDDLITNAEIGFAKKFLICGITYLSKEVREFVIDHLSAAVKHGTVPPNLYLPPSVLKAL